MVADECAQHAGARRNGAVAADAHARTDHGARTNAGPRTDFRARADDRESLDLDIGLKTRRGIDNGHRRYAGLGGQALRRMASG